MLYYFESERGEDESLVDCNGLETGTKLEMKVQWRGNKNGNFP